MTMIDTHAEHREFDRGSDYVKCRDFDSALKTAAEMAARTHKHYRAFKTSTARLWAWAVIEVKK